MSDNKRLPLRNGKKLHDAGIKLLDQAHDIVAASGENADSMVQIGTLLQNISCTSVLDELLALRPFGVDVIAQHEDGSLLTFYAMTNWQSPPRTDVHWHNYWQILTVVEGSWPDTVWKPVARSRAGTAEAIAIDRRVVIDQGDVQPLGPDEPHGWLAEDRRRTDRAMLLMWSGNARGKPRVVLDPESGRLSKDYGFLNPEPGSAIRPEGRSTFSYNRF